MRLVCSFALILLASAALLAQSNPVPLINQPLVPASAAPGGAGFNLTVTGTGFTSASVVEWNGATLITTVVSSQKLTAKVPAARIAKAGTASISVVNPGVAASNVVYFPIASTEASIGFTTKNTPPGGPGVTIAGDFNRDGKLDLLGALGFVEVLQGNGHGGFGSPIVSGCPAGNLSVADVNNDGILDVTSTNANTTQVCLGNGDSTFTPQFSITTQQQSYSTVIGDFNRDGKLDLGVVTYNGETESMIQIWLGNGTGTFQIGQSYEVGSCPLSGLTADFNQDGILDLAFPDYCANSMNVMLGNGDGTFHGAGGTNSASAAQFAAVADFNGDGKPDLAVTGQNGGVLIFLGVGDGTFQPGVLYPINNLTGPLSVADLNNDGRVDLAVANFTASAISILFGNGDGTFQGPINFATPSLAFRTFGDFNNDGRLDLVFNDVGNASIAIMFQSLQATAVLTPSGLTFAAQDVGVPSPSQPVTLTNTGAATLTINSITFAGTDSGDFSQTNTCGTTVPPGASCIINVTFTPTITGTRTASLNVSDNASGSPQTVSLSGTGVAPAVTLSSNTLTFPTQLLHTTSAAQQVTLTNTGTGTLNITSIVASGEFTQTNTCGTSVGVGASCTITVQFSPTQKDTGTGMVTITDDAPGSPQTIALTGCGTVVKLSGIAVNFGNQKVGTTSPPVTVTITNVSSQTLTISSISIGGSNGADFTQTNTCSSGVPGHGSCKISLQFTPTKTGARSATLSISDNGGCSPQQVTLSGTGI